MMKNLDDTVRGIGFGLLIAILVVSGMFYYTEHTTTQRPETSYSFEEAPNTIDASDKFWERAAIAYNYTMTEGVETAFCTDKNLEFVSDAEIEEEMGNSVSFWCDSPLLRVHTHPVGSCYASRQDYFSEGVHYGGEGDTAAFIVVCETNKAAYYAKRYGWERVMIA